MFRRVVPSAVLAVVLPLVGFSGTPTAADRAAASSPVPAAVPAAAPPPALPQLWAPASSTPAYGASFNNPATGDWDARRNLRRVVRMIDSTPGYRVRTPASCAAVAPPNEIRIALYSFSDGKVADALIRAHRRCISVQVLMNDHLTNGQVPAFGRLQKALGNNRAARSYARRCQLGCRGSIGPLHTKMYLFSRTGNASPVVGFGSTNMTGKAAYVQWNDLFVFKNRAELYRQFVQIFEEMELDSVAPPPLERNYWDGPLLTMYWPQPGHTMETDRVLKALKEVRCNVRPTGGTGYAGHTAIQLNIHAMEGDRGMYIAQYLVAMRRAGCRVRVLYGLIAPRIHQTLKDGGVARRRTIFDRNGDDLTDMYTHMKVLSVNGVYLDNTAARVVFTGSENFSQKTIGADEVWMKIPSSLVWTQYRKLFDKIWNSNYYSNPTYKFYQQTDTPIHGRTVPGALKVTRGDLEL